MIQDKEPQQLLNNVAEALSKLKTPFYFEQDTAKVFRGGGKESKLKSEMQNARIYCDKIGVRFVQLGSVSLAIIVFAENLSNEEAIGRSVVVKNSVASFTQFDLRNRLAFPFYANIFYVFSSSEKSFNFRSNAQEQCKQQKVGLLRIIQVKPWCIDFQGKHVVASQHLLSGLDKEPAEIESKLFTNISPA